MGIKTGIEWTDASVNFWTGCHKLSPGCANCYMFTEQTRYGQDPDTVKRCKDATFYVALKWEEPKHIFTCSWSDFFIEEADEWRADAWDVIRKTRHHTWQILTKRTERIADHLPPDWGDGWPHVWLGTTVENRKTVKRVHDLVKIPAAVHFLSCEPLLEEVELPLWQCLNCNKPCAPILVNNDKDFGCPTCKTLVSTIGPFNKPGYPLLQAGIDWVICGFESGAKARPGDPDWARSLRDQCKAARVAFFFKQWGEFAPESAIEVDGSPFSLTFKDNAQVHLCEGGERVYRVGKKRAGRVLDGRTWDELPTPSTT